MVWGTFAQKEVCRHFVSNPGQITSHYVIVLMKFQHQAYPLSLRNFTNSEEIFLFIENFLLSLSISFCPVEQSLGRGLDKLKCWKDATQFSEYQHFHCLHDKIVEDILNFDKDLYRRFFNRRKYGCSKILNNTNKSHIVPAGGWDPLPLSDSW